MTRPSPPGTRRARRQGGDSNDLHHPCLPPGRRVRAGCDAGGAARGAAPPCSLPIWELHDAYCFIIPRLSRGNRAKASKLHVVYGGKSVLFSTSFEISGGGWLVGARGRDPPSPRLRRTRAEGRNGLRQARQRRVNSGPTKGGLPRSGGHPPRKSCRPMMGLCAHPTAGAGETGGGKARSTMRGPDLHDQHGSHGYWKSFGTAVTEGIGIGTDRGSADRYRHVAVAVDDSR